MNECLFKYCFNWKTVGIAIGWIGMILSIGIGVLYAPLIILFGGDVFVYGTLITIALNILMSITWLIGIAKKTPILMSISLFWWAMLLGVWILFVLHVVSNGMHDIFLGNRPYLIRNNPVYAITMFCGGYYFFAVMSYKTLKSLLRGSLAGSSQFDVSYAVPIERNGHLIQVVYI